LTPDRPKANGPLTHKNATYLLVPTAAQTAPMMPTPWCMPWLQPHGASIRAKSQRTTHHNTITIWIPGILWGDGGGINGGVDGGVDGGVNGGVDGGRVRSPQMDSTTDTSPLLMLLFAIIVIVSEHQ